MPVDPILDIVAHTRTLPELARALGEVALDNEGSLRRVIFDRDAIAHYEVVRAYVARIRTALWLDQPASAVGLLLDQSVVSSVMSALGTNHGCYALLRALCHQPTAKSAPPHIDGPLTTFYAEFRSIVPLDRGVAFPLPTRSTHHAVPEKTTPNPYEQRSGHLLGDTPFALWRAARDDASVVIDLDFTARDQLDASTWREGTDKRADPSRFPRVATVHPLLADDLGLEPPTNGTFFGVKPKPERWDDILAEIIRQLVCARRDGATIAVLPELCLPSPDALLEEVSKRGVEVPDLIVCGSAHLRTPATPTDDEVRSNEVVILLNGSELIRHKKVHPYTAAKLLPEDGPGPFREDITTEPKTVTIAASRHTRLATVICADLNDRELPGMLSLAGVNVLLVASLTDSPGSYNTACAQINGPNQGFAVIANGTHPAATPGTFLAMAFSPIADPSKSAASSAPPATRRTYGIIDFSAKQPDVITWESQASAA